MRILFFFILGALLQGPSGVPLGAQETPLERSGFQRLTSHEELVDFVEELATASDRVSSGVLGASVEGRAIPYLRVSLSEFGDDRESRLLALFFAQQHGDEPSGKEALLSFARDLAVGTYDDLLRSVDLLLVPQVNPDGAERGVRRNADGVDLNRSHLLLDGTEVRHLRELFHRWQPEVTVDLHEYSPWTGSWLDRGWLRLFDVQIGLPTNLNTHPSVRSLAEESALPFLERFLDDRGFTAHNYLVGNPGRIRYSTTNVNDGRQGFAILNTLSFIYEGRRGRTPVDRIERRTRGQHLALEGLLQFLARRGDEVRATVRDARAEVIRGGSGEVALTMRREPGEESLRIPVEAVQRENGRWVGSDTVVVEVEGFRPRVVPGRTQDLPRAYLIPAEQPELRALLERHRVEMREVEPGERVQVERPVVLELVNESLERATRLPLLRYEAATHVGREGDVLVPTAQLRGLLVATALEPASMHSLFQSGGFGDLLRRGPFPLLRVP